MELCMAYSDSQKSLCIDKKPKLALYLSLVQHDWPLGLVVCRRSQQLCWPGLLSRPAAHWQWPQAWDQWKGCRRYHSVWPAGDRDTVDYNYWDFSDWPLISVIIGHCNELIIINLLLVGVVVAVELMTLFLSTYYWYIQFDRYFSPQF